MDAIRRSTGGIVTALLLATVIAGSQLVSVPRNETPIAFSLTPSGEEVARLSPITVTFPRTPEEDARPESLLQLLPATAGAYAWLSPKTLLFQPDFPGLLRGATYTALVPANAEAGVPQTIARKFTVGGKLVVQQVIPGNGDTEVPLDAQVLVQFNRSVAALTTLSNQPKDQVVTFDPPLHGTGDWLNTSIYRFVPSDLSPTTTYTVKVKRGLSSAADGVLEADFSSTFTTISPAVDAISPDGAWLYGGPWQEVQITFNQAMDPGTADGVSVKNALTGEVVAERATWDPARMSLTLNPTASMAPETKYVITVPRGLRSARGAATVNERTSTFTTVGRPRVQQTYPANGERSAGRYGISFQFTNPMDFPSFDSKIHVSGIDDKDLEGRVNGNQLNLGVQVQLKASTTYTVTIDPGALDVYGQPMDGYRFSFTTGALDPSVALAVPGYSGSATYSASAEPFLFFQTTNKTSVTFTLTRLGADEAKRVIYDQNIDPKWTPSARPMRTWTEQLAPAKDEYLLSKTSVSGGGPLPAGYYYVTTDGQIGSRLAFAVVDTVLVTKLSLDELLVWALDHDTGKPLEGVTIAAAGAGTGEVTTDARGLAVFHPFVPVPGSSGDRTYWLTTKSAAHFGVVSTRWQGVSPYQFGLPGEYFARQYVGHVYTDRPIYRPGETVFYKGIVRADDDASYSMPPADAFTLVIRNSRSQEVKRESVRLDGFGSFGGFFDLPADVPTGDYGLWIEVTASNHYTFAGNSFSVAEFRTPEFQVALGADRTSYINGDAIDATVDASFFFGGAVGGARAAWSVVADTFALRPKGFESYSFSDYDWARQAVATNPVRASGAATTGGDGKAAFRVPAALSAAEGAMRFTVSATVTDQNGQAVAGSTQVTVHPASLYAGIRAEHYVATAGVAETLRLVSVDTAGSVVGGQNVRVEIYDRQWITTKVAIPGGGRRYQSDVKDVLLTTLGARTASDGTASVTYTPQKAGTLRMVAVASDAKGRTSRSAAYLWVSGGGLALWQVTNDDTIKLVADKDRYEVGDTAHVLVPAPFAGATALVTVERGKIITRETRVLATNSESLAIPIVDRSVPNVFVSVVLYRGPTELDPLPRYKVGYVELPVDTAVRKLSVSITPDRAQAKPGDTVRYAIAVTDANGKGVRSEVSVAVVDKAVLSLMDERGPDGMHAFWFERGLAVSTNSSMGVSMDRWNDVIAELPRQGKGGSGVLSGAIRQDFRNTAYWQAQLVTKDDGTATVDVVMPDNLTTWRMQARAISGDTMVGEGTNELVSTKPLLIRSALPRFFRTGDAVDLRILVRNGTGAAVRVPVTLAATGPIGVDDPLTAVQDLPSDGRSFAYVWHARITGEGTVKVTFTANGTTDSDAMSVSVPAYVDMTPETMSTGGVVTTESGVEAVFLPQFADTAHGTLGVGVRSSLVGPLASELPSFDRIPGSVYPEDTVAIASRVIATIAVARADQAAGITTSYDSRITTDLAELVGRQRPDGGWPWCIAAECSTDPNVTGWVLLALGEARRDSHSIDPGVSSRAASYVYTFVNRPNTTTEATTSDQDQRAFMLAALASAGGTGVWNIANALFEQYRAKLANWGRAYLIDALVDGGGKPEDAQPRALLNDLAATTIPSANGNHWEDTATANRVSFMTSTATTALVALAIARVQPTHALLAQTVRWLTVARGANGWQTSVERAMSILALATYVQLTGEQGAEFGYSVSIDQKSILTGTVHRSMTPTSESARIPLNTVTPGKASILSVDREFAKTGRLYYTVDLRYMTPAKDVEAVNRGFGLSHTYTLLTDPSRPITSAHLGDVVRVTLTVLAPSDRNYVTIEDLLPAGLEAIDARLRTTDPALKKQLDEERVAAFQRGATGFVAPWYRWYWSPWQQVDTRDDRTVLQTDRLAKGVYEYTYYARATATGTFFVAPAHAAETYFPEVFGRGDSSRFTVVP